ncbi:tRNA (adenosine(37)-N6)-threonylcarbamoyltransferase complex transferase subunit TsaD [Eilatimonas milleporae]|uniref:tRNA N6-adenosine threonylcarbamoyltransferase n=1 Tax=Eilatimonas milleporae TaxID=911205 RepID=A0A3M0BVI6_9PROT|nr:tRNA (adenosine(37)-N6)-threonylcarbamoyltransferase complex transferase subunit TsaD [Eilatimonas milleporae]RMB00565.1 O-sialoglycoprotein endopeptidase [Eilatimonas milleporae]
MADPKTENPIRKPGGTNRGDPPLVLGLETSCDETAVAVVDGAGHVRAHHVLSQVQAHADYGGVVPEVAARQHIQHLDGLIRKTLDDAKIGFDALDAIAATSGPGLIGGLIVGVMTAKAMAAATGLPFIAVNHLEGHALSARLTEEIAFPYLLVLMSGGHCQILAVEGVGRYRRYGSTIDDAAGEAFDKTAKLLGLGYPGGPAVEREAGRGNPDRFKLPRPLMGTPGCDFSFSGLKTAVRQTAEALVAEKGAMDTADRADLCAGFQAAVTDCLADRVGHAVARFQEDYPDFRAKPAPLVVAGGVAANTAIRRRLTDVATSAHMVFHAPPLEYCTDNGAMIAWAGVEILKTDPARDDMAVGARPRWPLDDRAPARIGSGKKGVKA